MPRLDGFAGKSYLTGISVLIVQTVDKTESRLSRESGLSREVFCNRVRGLWNSPVLCLL